MAPPPGGAEGHCARIFNRRSARGAYACDRGGFNSSSPFPVLPLRSFTAVGSERSRMLRGDSLG